VTYLLEKMLWITNPKTPDRKRTAKVNLSDTSLLSVETAKYANVIITATKPRTENPSIPSFSTTKIKDFPKSFS